MVVRYKGTFDAGKRLRKQTDLSFRRKDHEKVPFPFGKSAKTMVQARLNGNQDRLPANANACNNGGEMN